VPAFFCGWVRKRLINPLHIKIETNNLKIVLFISLSMAAVQELYHMIRMHVPGILMSAFPLKFKLLIHMF
jgi:hypothetical protein